MSRHAIAGVICLALAGCTHDRSLISRTNNPVPTVAMTPPLPSIYDAINEGPPRNDTLSTNSGHSIESTKDLKDRPNPLAQKTSAQNPDASANGFPESPSQHIERPDNLQPGPVASTIQPHHDISGASGLASPIPEDEVPLVAEQGRVKVVLPDATSGQLSPPVPSAPGTPVAISARPAEAKPAVATRDPLLGPNPDIMPEMNILPVARESKASALKVFATDSAKPGNLRSLPMTASAPTSSHVPLEDSPTAREKDKKSDDAHPVSMSQPAPVQVLGHDPLLGPDPDVMPGLELPTKKLETSKSRDVTTSATVTKHILEKVDATAILPLPDPTATLATKPPEGLKPSSRPPVPATTESKSSSLPPAALEKESFPKPVELPTLPGLQAPMPGENEGAMIRRGGTFGFASVPVSPPADKKGKQDVHQSDDPTAVRSKIPTRSVFEAGKPAARVGDDVITYHELSVAVAHRRRGLSIDRALSKNEVIMLNKTVLNDLIDRSVILQEAKHDLKDAKKFKTFMDIAQKVWTEEELPPMLKQTSSLNIHELRQKMSERGESLDELREQFKLEFLSRGYLEQKLSPKMKVDLPEMREYYASHLKDFDRPAQVTWRELVVEVGKYKSRAAARKKAESLLARLQNGDDFVILARTESDGPNKSAEGLWETVPGSYAVQAVNAALETLPIGKASGLLEGQSSFHIVRVEARRRAGPSSFAEVQDKIKRSIRQEKIHRESTAYLDKLRKRTVITTAYDDPSVIPASAERIGPPSASSPR